MSDLVGRIETRIHDSPMPIEHLLDECADEIRRLERIGRVNASLAKQLSEAMRINAVLCEDNKRLVAQVAAFRSQAENAPGQPMGGEGFDYSPLSDPQMVELLNDLADLNVDDASEAALREASKRLRSQAESADDWKEDPAADERWNAGLDYGMVQLCAVLNVDLKKVNWDAATETLDGDVCAAINNVFRVKYGDDFDPTAPAPTPPKNEDTIAEILRLCDEAPMEISTWSEEVRRMIERMK